MSISLSLLNSPFIFQCNLRETFELVHSTNPFIFTNKNKKAKRWRKEDHNKINYQLWFFLTSFFFHFILTFYFNCFPSHPVLNFLLSLSSYPYRYRTYFTSLCRGRENHYLQVVILHLGWGILQILKWTPYFGRYFVHLLIGLSTFQIYFVAFF